MTLTPRGRTIRNLAITFLVVAFFVAAAGLAGTADLDTYRQMEARR